MKKIDYFSRMQYKLILNSIYSFSNFDAYAKYFSDFTTNEFPRLKLQYVQNAAFSPPKFKFQNKKFNSTKTLRQGLRELNLCELTMASASPRTPEWSQSLSRELEDVINR